MINHIKAGNKFYPTDHCGVVRIKTDKILPEYFALALEVEGKQENFSCSNRASTERIKRLGIYVPDDVTEQHRIMNEIKKEKNAEKYQIFHCLPFSINIYIGIEIRRFVNISVS